MKKILTILMAVLLLASCATLQPQPAAPPDQQTVTVDQETLKKMLEAVAITAASEQTVDQNTLQKMLEALAETAASNFRPFTCLIGGTAGCVDAISAADLNDGDVAIVFTISGTDYRTYTYVYDDDTSVGEDSTRYTVIQPDDFSVQGEWHLVPLPMGGISDNTATTRNVSVYEAMHGTFFTNTNAGTKTFVLPPAQAGMSVCIRNGYNVSQILRFDTDGTDYIVMPDGQRTGAAGDWYGCTADAANQLCAVAVDSTDWYITSEVGTCDEETP